MTNEELKEFTESHRDINLIEYHEKLNTDKKLMLNLLDVNIKAVDLMAANILHPHEEYPVFVELMKKLKKGYK